MFEKKMHELYQEKKQADEKSIPDFDDFRNELERVNNVAHSYLLLKIAASVALVVSAGTYYFHGSRRSANEVFMVYPANGYNHLPTQSLLDQSTNTGYIWNWKAPTDQLLNTAKALKTDL